MIPPSYIPAETFALALMSLVRGSAALPVGESLFQNARGSIVKRKLNKELEQALLAIHDGVAGDTVAFKKALETWFDNGMDRASGWFKRRTQVWLLGISVVVVPVGNFDAIAISKSLWRDDAVGTALVQQAGKLPAKLPASEADLRKITNSLKALDLPIGWESKASISSGFSDGSLFLRVPGWLISIFAISFGAPFWFDAVQNLLRIRSAGVKPKKTEDKTNGKKTG